MLLASTTLTGLPLLAVATEAAATSRPRPTLFQGDCGRIVADLQRRLIRLRYAPGYVTGCMNPSTIMAVWALQKANRLRPTAAVGPKTWRALDRGRVPRPLVRTAAAPKRVEINLTRQLMHVYRRNRLALTTHISTGAQRRYCHNGRCGYAITPVGDYRVYRQNNGWQTGPLGSMYKPMYFRGGIAMHGSTSVPLYPASHGCVRLPLNVAHNLHHLVHKGQPVYVRRPPRR
ncbi:Putative peptidoglycan binding domain-containing protein [Sinosporangium album]|uniref:Putative peptidoglycan binding domain-containing protein n=1 Tax=Sinosporangium album TaxID=504805 RepID=A0A1G7YAF6_9ACTN|nr:L,D-transpeptidase family protein [Sinosporangium album]SDG93375.1 Putative peptidoglycan binding domain-containing protein [Sinosporangium album]